MSFTLPYIPKSDELIDNSFREGKKVAISIRRSKKPKSKKVREKIAEEKRIKAISKKICDNFREIIKKFPSYETMPRFYRRLLDIKIEKDKYKKSLGSLQWCVKSVKKLEKEKIRELKKTREIGDVKRISREFLGRVASMIKQVGKELKNLREIRKILKEFPDVDMNKETLVIAGYANAGKSTFMRTLTGSKVKIASYPFTTKDIMLGYKTFKHKKYQIIDTPGLLDRPLEKRNKIELQAILALEELADKILFIFDPIQEFKPQLSLYNELKENFTEEIFPVINKRDITDEKQIYKFKRLLKKEKIMEISAKNKEECKQVFIKIFNLKDEET